MALINYFISTNMLVSAFKKPILTSLTVLNNNSITGAPDYMHAVTSRSQLPASPVSIRCEPALQIVTAEPVSDQFTITFSYGQQLHRTKVLRVGSGYSKPAYVYKVALSSRLCSNAKMCWLQQTSEGWNTLLGKLDVKLLKAITSAIETME